MLGLLWSWKSPDRIKASRKAQSKQSLGACLQNCLSRGQVRVRVESGPGQGGVRPRSRPTSPQALASGMGTRAAKIPCGPGPLLWLLLLLLPLSPKADPVLKPSIPSPPKVPGLALEKPQPQQGWEPSASRNQDLVNRSGLFERQWAGNEWVEAIKSR